MVDPVGMLARAMLSVHSAREICMLRILFFGTSFALAKPESNSIKHWMKDVSIAAFCWYHIYGEMWNESSVAGIQLEFSVTLRSSKSIRGNVSILMSQILKCQMEYIFVHRYIRNIGFSFICIRPHTNCHTSLVFHMNTIWWHVGYFMHERHTKLNHAHAWSMVVILINRQIQHNNNRTLLRLRCWP